ncbi:hypothetical protein WCT81_04850 [Pectobacterium versatile]|uniref:phage tail termination protein n=1 Tax=Pectobacterium versatile TaxID=2488639 RepID=UPI002087B90F|nr:hypothetical protein SOASR014_41650 [Pectobacterium carotovorum subsp. carotovorum]GLX46558.1 hypothetical protein Pcaca01_42260 [Pectobacterium carotovorum subsp. carotovorum]
MTVFEKFAAWLEAAKLPGGDELIDGYRLQLVQWIEQNGDAGAMRYIVVQPDGGTPRYRCLGAYDYVLVNIISAKNDPEPAIATAQAIMEHVTNNADDDVLNFIANAGGFPTPIPTEEGRTVIRLRFEIIS